MLFSLMILTYPVVRFQKIKVSKISNSNGNKFSLSVVSLKNLREKNLNLQRSRMGSFERDVEAATIIALTTFFLDINLGGLTRWQP